MAAANPEVEFHMKVFLTSVLRCLTIIMIPSSRT